MAIVLLVIASFVILPFLTYYVTSTLFFRKSSSTTIGKEPPTIPYFIPALFHAFGFAHAGARRYFEELIKDYGAFAPFKVRAGPRSYVVLRDPTHICRVLNAPEHLTATTSKREVLDKLFGSPRAEKHLTRSGASSQKDNDGKEPTQLPFSILDSTLASTTEVYISILSTNMHDKMFQYDTWTRIEDLWSFLQLVLLRCTLDTLFGSALLKKYPRMVRDYREFSAAIEDFVYGMPRLMISGASKPRDRLHQGLRKWLIAPEIDHKEVHNTRGKTTDDLTWNEMTGMEFIRERYHNTKFDNDEEVDLKARVAEVLSIIHTTNAELVSCTFWTTIETLRKSHLTRNMTAIAVQHLSPITHRYDVLGLTQEPLVKSLQTEVHRLRTAYCVVRTNETNGFPLDKQWSLRKGASVVMFSHDIALNTDVWKKIQPKFLERPLEEFWAERFIVPDWKSKPKKDAVAAGNPDAVDLGDLVTRLTVSDHYPGTRFISALQVATMAVLFAEFEIQLCDTEQVDAALPPVGEFAYGTVKPLEKIPVRLRKRRT